MFINYDLIRQQAQGYNVNLEALYVPLQRVAEQSIGQRLLISLRSVVGGGNLNARRAKAKPAFTSHGVVAK